MAGLYVASVTAAAIALTAADAQVPQAEDAVAFGSAQPRAATPAGQAADVAPAYAIAFESPVKGEGIDSPFGLRRMPWEAHGRLHEGVDIAAASGAPVHAAAAGVVARAGKSPSYGHFVEIVHAGGLKTLYAHMGSQAAGLWRGARLDKGRIIGFVGNTGRSTGAHLHFEIRKGGRPLDPQQFIGRSFARLGDLPIARAARYPRGVRVAYVSRWPASVLKARAQKAVEVKLAAATAAEPKAELVRIRTVGQPAPAAGLAGVKTVGQPAPASAMITYTTVRTTTAPAPKAAPQPVSPPKATPIHGVTITPLENGRVRAVLTVGS